MCISANSVVHRKLLSQTDSVWAHSNTFYLPHLGYLTVPLKVHSLPCEDPLKETEKRNKGAQGKEVVSNKHLINGWLSSLVLEIFPIWNYIGGFKREVKTVYHTLIFRA